VKTYILILFQVKTRVAYAYNERKTAVIYYDFVGHSRQFYLGPMRCRL